MNPGRRWLRSIPDWALTALLIALAAVTLGLLTWTVWKAIGWVRHGEWLSVIFAVGFWGLLAVVFVRELREASQQGREDALRELRDQGYDV